MPRAAHHHRGLFRRGPGAAERQARHRHVRPARLRLRPAAGRRRGGGLLRRQHRQGLQLHRRYLGARGLPVQSVKDLAGKSLALSSVGSTSGDALPRKAIVDAGLKPEDVKVNYAGGHAESLLALAKGTVDAAEINSQQQASATASKTFDPARFRKVWASDPIPNDPITVRGNLDPAFKKAVADTLLNLPADKVGQIGALLAVKPAAPLVAVDKSTYQPLFDLAATLHLTDKDL